MVTEHYSLSFRWSVCLAHSRQKIHFLVTTCGKNSGEVREGGGRGVYRQLEKVGGRVYKQPREGKERGVYIQPRASLGEENPSFSSRTAFLNWSLGT